MNDKISKNSNWIPEQNNNIFLSLTKLPTPGMKNNEIANQYSNAITESIILSKKEKNPENQIITFFLQRAKKIYKISKNKKRVLNKTAYINLLNNYNQFELLQVASILDEGIASNTFKVCDTTLTGKAMINAIKGFDFLIYQGKTFKELTDEIKEVVRIFISSIKK